MELAEDRKYPRSPRSSRVLTSEKMRFTPAWASSKFPTTAQTPTFSPSWVTIWASWTWETPSLG